MTPCSSAAGAKGLFHLQDIKSSHITEDGGGMFLRNVGTHIPELHDHITDGHDNPDNSQELPLQPNCSVYIAH